VKIGLAGDSFGNLEALDAAFDTLFAAGAERVFFLGGRQADVDAVLACRREAMAARQSVPAAEGDLDFLRAVEGALGQRVAGRLPEDEAERLRRRLVCVASAACAESRADAPPRKVFELMGGLICCLVHDKCDLARDDIENAAVIFHGNSATAALVTVGPRLFITPGQLRAVDSRGRPPTFALVGVGPEAVELTVFSAGGVELRREMAPLAARGKVSVR
jgi:predicted phosphodiesterase